MKITLIVGGVLSLALAGSLYFGYVQTKSLALEEAKVASLTFVLEEKNKKIKENNASIELLTSKYKESERVSVGLQEKALKDITRVRDIALKKAKLYERLVNRDFKRTQKQLKEITQ